MPTRSSRPGRTLAAQYWRRSVSGAWNLLKPQTRARQCKRSVVCGIRGEAAVWPIVRLIRRMTGYGMGRRGIRAHLQAEEPDIDTLTHRTIAWAFTRQSVAWAIPAAVILRMCAEFIWPPSLRDAAQYRSTLDEEQRVGLVRTGQMRKPGDTISCASPRRTRRPDAAHDVARPPSQPALAVSRIRFGQNRKHLTAGISNPICRR